MRVRGKSRRTASQGSPQRRSRSFETTTGASSRKVQTTKEHPRRQDVMDMDGGLPLVPVERQVDVETSSFDREMPATEPAECCDHIELFRSRPGHQSGHFMPRSMASWEENGLSERNFRHLQSILDKEDAGANRIFQEALRRMEAGGRKLGKARLEHQSDPP